MRALEFLGGVPRQVVPDNLRSGVAISRAEHAFDHQGESAAMLISVSATDERPLEVLGYLSALLQQGKADRLLKADAAGVYALLTSEVDEQAERAHRVGGRVERR